MASKSSIEFQLKDNKLRITDTEIAPQIRHAIELKDVLYDTKWLKGNELVELYYMYRNIGEKIVGKIRDGSLRYDITIMKSIRLGEELNKTLGHYHPIAEKGLSYPELYEVLKGKAIYLLQDHAEDNTHVLLIHAKKGDKLLIPPNYGHITINAGNTDLIMGNLVSNKFESDYAPIVKKHGGAVYVLTDERIMVNKNYKRINLEILDSPSQLAFAAKGSILQEFAKNPEKFEFLNKPSLLWK